MKFYKVIRLFLYLVCFIMTVERIYQTFHEYSQHPTGMNMYYENSNRLEMPRYVIEFELTLFCKLLFCLLPKHIQK